MASSLFDPLLDLALAVAKKGKKAKPPIPPPARLVPMLKFAKLPDKAKDAVLDVLNTDDEFRARVAEAADEKTVGRTGLAYVERGDGWERFVNQMLEAADEPIITSSAPSKKLEHQLDVADRARQRAEAELAEATSQLDAAEALAAEATSERDALRVERDELAASNTELAEQRHRAVAELKRTEEIMARHIAERKRLEALVETMTAAQLSTTAVGGAVSDEEVRLAVDVLEGSIANMADQLSSLRRAATPERVPVARRVALPVPHGLVDSSVDYAEYLLSIPNMTVLVDGYNVTKLAHDDWELERQRDWLEQGLCAIAARVSATFDVVFDGADVGAVGGAGRDRGVRIRFSPDGVEADDVIIDAVGSTDQSRPVTVVSSDKRVRAGAASSGANVISSAQLIDLLA